MKVILFGATGMVGQGVLRECLLDPGVEHVVSVSRSPTGQHHPKLRELLRADLSELHSLAPELRDVDACFYCLGVSSVGMTEAAYRRITYDLTVNVARTLIEHAGSPLTFAYVSGAGTDRSEQGRVMWARVKGATENALLSLPFKAAYMFRPGVIQPLHGIRSKTAIYRALYALLAPFLSLLRAALPRQVLTTEQVGRAMLAVARDRPDIRSLESADVYALSGRPSKARSSP